MIIIKRPVISEKSSREATKNRYTFEVEEKAGKKEIKEEVERLFKVKVAKVRTLKVHGKTVRRGKKRNLVKKSNLKKAVVALREGDKIDIFETGS